jgi:hypothetical protein
MGDEDESEDGKNGFHGRAAYDCSPCIHTTSRTCADLFRRSHRMTSEVRIGRKMPSQNCGVVCGHFLISFGIILSFVLGGVDADSMGTCEVTYLRVSV